MCISDMLTIPVGMLFLIVDGLFPRFCVCLPCGKSVHPGGARGIHKSRDTCRTLEPRGSPSNKHSGKMMFKRVVPSTNLSAAVVLGPCPNKQNMQASRPKRNAFRTAARNLLMHLQHYVSTSHHSRCSSFGRATCTSRHKLSALLQA